MATKQLPQFSPETLAWLARANLKDRQSKGQFMTPRVLRSHLLNQLHMKPGDRVLDPAVGTGEFLKDALEIEPGITVTGWDIDETIIEVARECVPKAHLVCRSALDEYDGELFDLVIGNPPYFEMKLDQEQKLRFQTILNGRPNIYSLFFRAGIDALKPGGTLAYVVPPSMNAGAYFKNLRKYLTSENHVLSLKVFEDPSMFVDAQTSVQIIVVKKGPGISRHTFEISNTNPDFQSLIFCEDPQSFGEMYKGCVSLASLGYDATTGNTVWNQHKENLTNELSSDSVPLLYARNIVSGHIQLSEDDRRPQYIRTRRFLTGEAIVVNRIIGGVGKGQIKAAMVPEGYKFAAENHLNVIRPIKGAKQLVDIASLFEMISSPEVIVKVRSITGNTQLSATEWTHVVPIRYPIHT